MKLKEKCVYFKREARNYIYMQKMIPILEEEIEELRSEMTGISSPAFKEVLIENAGDPYKDKKLAMIVEISRKEEEKKSFEIRTKWIDAVFDGMEEKKRNIAFSILVLGANAENVAFNEGYSKQNIYKIIDSAIKKSILKMKI